MGIKNLTGESFCDTVPFRRCAFPRRVLLDRERSFLYHNKESRLRDSPPAAGRFCDIVPFRRCAFPRRVLLDREQISLSSNKRKSAAIRSALSHTSIDKILISYSILSRNRNLLMFPNTCLFYLCTRPEASPPASFFTSSTLTMLKSPSIECFKQLAATANSIVSCG